MGGIASSREARVPQLWYNFYVPHTAHGKESTMLKNKKLLLVLTSVLLAALVLTGCSRPDADGKASTASGPDSVIDYLVLVNKENPLPDGWEEALDITKFTNSVGDEVQVESTAYQAYLKLKADVEKELEKDNVTLELDSAYRSVAAQQKIVDDFTVKYGEEYVKQYVAVPGFSEHHTGLALDLYFRIGDRDIYENEDLVQYPDIWAAIHEKLADYGFILRYPEGKEDVTGYSYEPWHIRYVDDPDIAKEITDEGITLEEYLDEFAAEEAA